MVFRYSIRLCGALAIRRGRCGKMARWQDGKRPPPGTKNVPEVTGVACHRTWRVLPIVTLTTYGPGLSIVMVGKRVSHCSGNTQL